jgi:hypothetical protein
VMPGDDNRPRLIIADRVVPGSRGPYGLRWYRVYTNTVPTSVNGPYVYVAARKKPPTGFMMVIPDPRTTVECQYDLVEDWLPDE